MSAETAIVRAQEKLREMREAGIAPERLDPIEKLAREPKSRALAVVAMCYECVGRSADANWRREVAHCTSWGCPLWGMRPYADQAPNGHGTEKRAEAVRSYPDDSPLAAAAAHPESRRRAIAGKCYECMGCSRVAVTRCASRNCPQWSVRPWQPTGAGAFTNQ